MISYKFKMSACFLKNQLIALKLNYKYYHVNQHVLSLVYIYRFYNLTIIININANIKYLQLQGYKVYLRNFVIILIGQQGW